MTYTDDNYQQWKKSVEVDWFSQYIKTWIAFNAWYKYRFEGNNSDRDIIERIKNGEGEILNKIENFLSETSTLDESFKSNLASLHKTLLDAQISDNNRTVTFQNILDYVHAEPQDETIYNIRYVIQIRRSERIRKYVVTNLNDNTELCSNEILFRNEPHEWCSERALTVPQNRTLKSLLDQSSPFHDLLNQNGEVISLGGINFIANINLISRAIIEVLYNLRNVLFHGNISPSNQTQLVYQPAYQLLKSILPI